MLFITFSIKFLIYLEVEIYFQKVTLLRITWEQGYGMWKKSGGSVMEKQMDLELELTVVGKGLDIGLEGKQRIIDDPCIQVLHLNGWWHHLLRWGNA